MNIFLVFCRYGDGTFRSVVRPPMTQLYSIHAFVRSNGYEKQVPLVFMLMSSRETDDYVAVLEAILDCLPHPARVST